MNTIRMNDEEDVVRTTNLPNTYFAYEDAVVRSQMAHNLNPDFFDNPAHKLRVAEVQQILRNTFNKEPDYINKRGLGNNSDRPFEVVKMQHIRKLFKLIPEAVQREKFFKPLKAMDNITLTFTNSHVLIKIFEN